MGRYLELGNARYSVNLFRGDITRVSLVATYSLRVVFANSIFSYGRAPCSPRNPLIYLGIRNALLGYPNAPDSLSCATFGRIWRFSKWGVC